MKNLSKAIIAFILLPLAITACGSKKKEPERVSIQISYKETKENYYFPYVFDLKEYTVIKDEPNKNIVKMSMLFDANISTGAKVTFEKSDYPNDGFSDEDSFYKHVNLDNFEKVDIGSTDGVDKMDISKLHLTHKKVDNFDICFVTIMDSGLNDSWYSNFDVGIDNYDYYDKTGDHPEWTNKLNHKGFDITANRCLGFIEEYKNRVLDKNSQQIFYIFGHSRGGALANLVGAKLIDLDYQIVSYALASPAVTTSKDIDNPKYKHLYSYICSDDAITGLLNQDWGFARYGKTYSFSISDYLDEFREYNGYGVPNGSSKKLLKIFRKLSSGRDDFYAFSDKLVVETSAPLQNDQVQDYIDSVKSPFVDRFEELSNFVEFIRVDNGDGTTTVTVRTCPGFLMMLIGIFVSGIDDFTKMGGMSGVMEKLSKFSAFTNCFLKAADASMLDFIGLNPEYFLVCHYYPAYVTYLNCI